MVTVGIDPHKHVHVAVAVAADGRRLSRPLTVKNDADLIGVLLKWIRTIADGAPVTWAIEDGRGFARRLADGLLLTGHEVVWVPTRLMSAHRKLHAATGSIPVLRWSAGTARWSIGRASPTAPRTRCRSAIASICGRACRSVSGTLPPHTATACPQQFPILKRHRRHQAQRHHPTRPTPVPAATRRTSLTRCTR
ncbi:transposase [Streptomyces sp. NPDC101455]|uniref:IS110 family transposase n=1 Tax=Streptomyces sp. NPDC101455 TaxID=3366142 RepID=UPI00380548F2